MVNTYGEALVDGCGKYTSWATRISIRLMVRLKGKRPSRTTERFDGCYQPTMKSHREVAAVLLETTTPYICSRKVGVVS